MSIYYLLLAFCLVGSAFFSASETAFSSLNRIRLKNLAKTGDKKAALALNLSEDYDKLLSALLIGNNVVNILSTGLATLLFTKIFGDIGLTISTVVMTIIVLLFGEVGPKTLAKQNPEKFAMSSAGVLRFICTILTPFTLLMGLWQKLLNKIIKPDAEEKISEEELITIVEEAESGGAIDEHESRLIRSAIEFTEQEVGEILTSRVNITAVEETASAAEVESLFHEQGYSRLPVYRGNIDNIIGVIHEKDFYHERFMGVEDWQDGITPAAIVTPGAEISGLLRRLQRGKMHMAVVVDEFGGTMGIVTLEDILEELVGEIWDEHDEVQQDIRTLPGGKFAVKGSGSFDDFVEHFRLELGGEEYDAQTVGGFVTEHLQRIPAVGEEFTALGVKINVTKADERRVLEILLSPLAQQAGEAQEK